MNKSEYKWFNFLTHAYYVSIDGGENWENTLFINNRTGIIDVDYSPEDFNTIYASSWEKDRKAWDFDEDGSLSGIYKSIDAGKTWELLTDGNSGFPVGEGVGRIGISVFDNNVVYAIHDNQYRREKKEDSSKKENINLLYQEHWLRKKLIQKKEAWPL